MIKSSSLLLLFFALSCSSPNAPDSILLNGKVWTGISDTDFQEAIAIKGNQTIAVGKSSDLKKTPDSKIAGIKNSTTYDGFGELVKDKNGELTGVLRENAMNVVSKFVTEVAPLEKLYPFRNYICASSM
jgi:predicted amidohydrolase YtcJ